MNLINLFNFNFIKENLRKSKAVILLCTLLLPIINAIIFLIHALDGKHYIPSLFETSPLSFLGVYFIPVILSITLFNFIYKRKSSDFVMSLPLSKKEIFVSNTLAGIIVLVISNVINYLFIILISLFTNNVIVDYKMLFDMHLLWAISYIFVFVSCNVAASVSSNKVTTVVVTMLVLFLVPFFHSFVNLVGNSYYSDINVLCSDSSCRPINYECHVTKCNVNLSNNIYMYSNISKINNTSYTVPFGIFNSLLFNPDSNFVINVSIIKMMVLSVIYIAIGLFAFNKRKFEVVDTSFKNDFIHLVVKSLTTVPIICMYYFILDNSYVEVLTIIFLLVVIIAYLIIYDLITRKKVSNVFKSILGMFIVAIIVVTCLKICSKNEYLLDVNDIEKISFESEYLTNNLGYTYDKEIINYTIANVLNTSFDGNLDYSINLSIDSKKGSFNSKVFLDGDNYKKLVSMLNKDKTYLNTSIKVNDKTVFGIDINDILTINKSNELFNELINEYNHSGSDNIGYDSLFDVDFMIYDNYNIRSISFNVNHNKKLAEKIIDNYNMDAIKSINTFDNEIRSYSYSGNTNDMDDYRYYSSYEYDTYKIDKFIIENANVKVNVNEDYSYIEFYDDFGTHKFITNKVDELELVLSEIGDGLYVYEDGDIDEEFTY